MASAAPFGGAPAERAASRGAAPEGLTKSAKREDARNLRGPSRLFLCWAGGGEGAGDAPLTFRLGRPVDTPRVSSLCKRGGAEGASARGFLCQPCLGGSLALGKGARGEAGGCRHPAAPFPPAWAQLLFPGPGHRETLGGDRRGGGSAAHRPLPVWARPSAARAQRAASRRAFMARLGCSGRLSRPGMPGALFILARAGLGSRRGASPPPPPAAGGGAGKLPGSGPAEAPPAEADASRVWRSSEHFGGCREWSPLQGGV